MRWEGFASWETMVGRGLKFYHSLFWSYLKMQEYKVKQFWGQLPSALLLDGLHQYGSPFYQTKRKDLMTSRSYHLISDISLDTFQLFPAALALQLMSLCPD